MALSDGMECPHCQTRLEVAAGSRMIATTAGLIAGAIVWWATRSMPNILGFALPVLLSFVALGIVAPLVLTFTAVLHTAPAAPVFEPVAAHGGQAQAVHGHAGGHH
jgi:hypothetical protein